MKRLLNTLYVLTPKTRLSREGLCILVKSPDQNPVKVPVGSLDSVVCFAQVTHTAEMLDLCVQSGLTLTYLSEYGRFHARMEGPVSGNVLLRREQYRLESDAKASVLLTRFILTAKLANARRVLLRGARDGHGDVDLRKTADKLKTVGERLDRVMELDRLRGLEGEAAALYWGVFGKLI